MNCYNFENKISEFIEGELSQIIRKEFCHHKDECQKCENKLLEVSKIMETLPCLNQLKTSEHFENRLNKKIHDYNNKGPSIIERLLEFKPFGYRPSHAFGLAAAVLMIIFSSYSLLYQDRLPEINLDQMVSKSSKKDNNSIEFNPSIIKPKNNLPVVAESDTTPKPEKKYIDKRIKLVGGK